MGLSEEILNAISAHELFSMNLFGYTISVTDTVVVTWIVMAAIIILALFLTRKLDQVPEGKQNVIEVFVEFINSTAKSLIGHHWKHFAPYIGTVFLFLIVANTVSIFNVIPNWEQMYKLTHWEFFEHLPQISMRPPTRDVNVTASMAIMSILLVLFSGIRFKKFSGWARSLIRPTPVMLPFNVMDYFVRPMSLCFRLFGNILGAFVVMELIYYLLPFLAPGVLGLYFDIFDGILQAYIFVFLTSLYISEAIE